MSYSHYSPSQIAAQSLKEAQQNMKDAELMRMRKQIVDNPFKSELAKAHNLSDIHNAYNHQVLNDYYRQQLSNGYQIGGWYNGRQWDGSKLGKIGEVLINGSGGGGGGGGQIYYDGTDVTVMDDLLSKLLPPNESEEDIEPLKRMLEGILDE